MQDIVTTIAAQYVAEMAFALVLSALGAAGSFVMVQGARLLGEKRMALLSNKLTPAIERAKAAAEKQGLTGDALEAWVVSYLKQTMTGTVRKLKASDADLAKRVAGQVAQAKAKEAAGAAVDALSDALRKAGLPTT